MSALDIEPVFTPAKEGEVNCLDKLGGCFISGTRVHTDEGLKRIEEIKIGDLVLSSPEDGAGGTE